jgi:hypothetical protein
VTLKHQITRDSLVQSQRSLVDAVDRLVTLQERLAEAGYDDWNELLAHVAAEVRGECELIQSTLEADKAEEKP